MNGVFPSFLEHVQQLLPPILETIVEITSIFVQFASIEEFHHEFRDLHPDDQVIKLQKLLIPHMLRSKYHNISPNVT